MAYALTEEPIGGSRPSDVGAVREVRADRSRRRQRDDTSLAAPPHKIRPIRLIGALRRRGARGARELGRALADFHNVERQRGQRFGHSLTCSKTHKTAVLRPTCARDNRYYRTQQTMVIVGRITLPLGVGGRLSVQVVRAE